MMDYKTRMDVFRKVADRMIEEESSKAHLAEFEKSPEVVAELAACELSIDGDGPLLQGDRREVAKGVLRALFRRRAERTFRTIESMTDHRSVFSMRMEPPDNLLDSEEKAAVGLKKLEAARTIFKLQKKEIMLRENPSGIAGSEVQKARERESVEEAELMIDCVIDEMQTEIRVKYPSLNR